MTRTSPPVTTMPTSATRFARRIGASQREPARRAARWAGEVVLVLVTAQGYGGSEGALTGPSATPAEEPPGQQTADQAPRDSTAHCDHGQPPATNTVRIASPRAPEGSRAARVPRPPGAGRSGPAPQPEQQHPDKVGDGQHGLGAHRAREQQRQGDERRAAQEKLTSVGRMPPASGRAPSATPSTPSTTTCTASTDSTPGTWRRAAHRARGGWYRAAAARPRKHRWDAEHARGGA